jgi:hypothetical protein
VREREREIKKGREKEREKEREGGKGPSQRRLFATKEDDNKFD